MRDLCENLEEHKTVAFLLGTLSDDHNNLISLLEMRPEADMDFVKEKLVQEYERKSGLEENSDSAFKSQTNVQQYAREEKNQRNCYR